MKTKILFLSKHKNHFDEILPKFKDEDDRFEFKYCKNTENPDKLLDENNFDIIIVDSEIEPIDIIEFLTLVKRKKPKAIRVAFANSSFKSMGTPLSQLCHRIFSNPLDPDHVYLTIKKFVSLKKYITNEKIVKVVNNISELPTLPDTYFKLETELSSENVSMHRISEIITHDMAFTSKVLQIVNSSFFGLKKKVTLPSQAVNYLGRNVLKSLILYHKLYLSFKINDDIKDYFEKMWIHSNKVGRFAEELIYQAYYNEIGMIEDAYIGGLLHDIGKVVMLSVDGYPYDVFNLMKEKQCRFSQAEYELYDVSHSDVAAYFLALWGLPERIVEAVYSHKRDTRLDFSKFTVPNAVHIANLLATDLDLELKDIKELRLGAIPSDWMKYIENNSEK
ncbi:MAG: HDOD domain-containing protein [Melioribacteraceae bacterium]|nr:HDOD domain-containing protein [Melioribacteraceae bacterium]